MCSLTFRSGITMNRSLLKSFSFNTAICSQFTCNRWFFFKSRNEPNKNTDEKKEEDDVTELVLNEPKYCIDPDDPISKLGPPRSWDEIKDELKKWLLIKKDESVFIQRDYDVIIIGGGPIGCTLMNIVRKRFGPGGVIGLVDSDLSYDRFRRDRPDELLSPQLSVGHLTQQFSLKETIKLAQFTPKYIQELNNDAKELLGPDWKPITFRPFGHLVLATEQGVATLKENHIIQGNYGVYTELNTTYQLSQRFPWLNVNDIALGSLGQSNEGWFDPWEYLVTVRCLGLRRGSWYIEGTPLEFHFKELKYFGQMMLHGVPIAEYQPCGSLVIEMTDGKIMKLNSNYFVIALGSETGAFAKNLLYLNKYHRGLHGLEIPIKRKKHYVFYFEAREGGPGFCSPMVVDPTGVYVRRDDFSNNYLCGCSIPFEDPNANNLTANENVFFEHIWPILAHRIPVFKEIKLKSGWSYFEDHNYFDDSPFVGLHPVYHNIFFACGLGKHTYALAPGIANGLNEHIYNNYYSSIDLTRFNFNRIAQEVPLLENTVI